MDKKIVAIGGGTGLSTILSGLKYYTEDITAIVTVADDGGGSGVLRQELGILPPGDIRACILALSNTKESLEKLFSFRFVNGGLKGQSFGNLLIAALNEIYGDFGIAVKEASKVLNITGRVLPVTLDHMDLVAELENGKKFLGESAIPKFSKKENSPIKRMYLDNSEVKILDDCLKAIERAEVIVLGPGSLYTSIIPNLLIDKMTDAILNSHAKTIYICNLMTQSGETDNYTVRKHIDAIMKHSSSEILDFCFVNSKILDEKSLRNYKIEDSVQVIADERDEKFCEENGIKLILDDFIDTESVFIRHDADKISKKILEIANI